MGNPLPRRQRLHLRVAETIEHLYPTPLYDHVEDLAHHLWRPGAAADAGKTIKYLQMAGEKAIQRSANVEAIGHFRNALELIKIRSGISRAATAGTNPEYRSRQQPGSYQRILFARSWQRVRAGERIEPAGSRDTSIVPRALGTLD